MLNLSIFICLTKTHNMRVIYILLLLLLCNTYQGNAQTHYKVLFLGNSYTQYNSMSNLTASIAASLGDTLTHDQNTPGGYTFEGHNTNTTSLSKINADNWDYVVLQEQSQKPSFPPSQVATETYPFADSLNRKIKANDSCTTVMFYMTWGRKNGDASNCGFYPPLCTYEGMQQRLRESYLEMGQTHNAEVAPIGMVWKAVRDSFSGIELYNADQSHPNLAGSYLVACTFYSSMYHKSCIGAFVPVGISAGDALSIQQTVDRVVFDSLSLWRIDTTTLTAQIDIIDQDSNIVTFNSPSVADEYYWLFGDGSGSPLQNPTHTYQTDSTTTYQVSLTTFKGCESVVSNYTITVEVDTIVEDTTTSILPFNNHLSSLLIYPTPANNKIYLQTQTMLNGSVQIYNVNGKLVMELPLNPTIDVSGLENGTYILVATEIGKRPVTKKFMITK